MPEREALAFPLIGDDLNDFAPRPAALAGSGVGQTEQTLRPTETRKAIDAASHFPSREASQDGQLNLKGPQHVLGRFKSMCKADRRAYYDMLEILMDYFEGKEKA